MQLRVKKEIDGARLPRRAYPDDAGLDLFSAETYCIAPGFSCIVNTGISIDMGWTGLTADEVYVGLIRDRSGLAAKHQIHCLAGVVDVSYRGEIKVVLFNLGRSPFNIEPGDKIAQLLIQKVTLMEPVEVENIPESTRGRNGFGSTGK